MFEVNSKDSKMISSDVILLSSMLNLNKFCKLCWYCENVLFVRNHEHDLILLCHEIIKFCLYRRAGAEKNNDLRETERESWP